MHTSTRLNAGDFDYCCHTLSGAHPADFCVFCPDYHPQDRVGVVSPALEQGVLHTSHALLALTTAFYDYLRACGGDFFDYPQHFAFVGAEDGKVHAGNGVLPLDTPHLWDAWSWLDVWPDAKWVTAQPTASALLQRIFDYQINRLFWPRGLKPGAQEAQLPDYLWKMLRTSLKSVYLYGGDAVAIAEQAGQRLEIRVGSAAQELVQESIARLPAATNLAPLETPAAPQFYEAVMVPDFLGTLQG